MLRSRRIKIISGDTRNVENLIKITKSAKQGISNQVDSNIIFEQRKIEEILGLKTIIKNNKNNSGKISIEYKNLSQFEMVSKLLKKR